MQFGRRLFLLAVGLLYFSKTTVAQAQGASNQGFTLLPGLDTDKFPTELACELFIKDFDDIYFFGADGVKGSVRASLEFLGNDVIGNADFFNTADLLACAIKTGSIKMAYVPNFLTFFLELGTVAAGIVALLFVVIGAYKYTFSGLTDEKDSAKKTISHAVIGLVVSSMAWIIVQLVQSFVTS